MAPTIRRLSSAEIAERRREILREVRCTNEEEFYDRAERFLLTPQERALYDELRDLDFLAGI